MHFSGSFGLGQPGLTLSREELHLVRSLVEAILNELSNLSKGVAVISLSLRKIKFLIK